MSIQNRTLLSWLDRKIDSFSYSIERPMFGGHWTLKAFIFLYTEEDRLRGSSRFSTVPPLAFTEQIQWPT